MCLIIGEIHKRVGVGEFKCLSGASEFDMKVPKCRHHNVLYPSPDLWHCLEREKGASMESVVYRSNIYIIYSDDMCSNV